MSTRFNAMHTLLYLFACLLLLVQSSKAQNKQYPYNEALAKKLGADEYGMKPYTLVILNTGPVQVEAGALRDSLFASHMQNIGKLAAEGHLVVAGPLGKNPLKYRGIFILNTRDSMLARRWVEADGAVKHGIFEAIYLPFYGSAALQELQSIHLQLQKKSITD